MRFAIVFDAPGQGNLVQQATKMLHQTGGEVFTVTSEGIMDGVLNGFNAVVFPGGIASWTGLRKWNTNFAHAIRYFVAAGGGYLGVCAGAYIAGKKPAVGFSLYCNRTLALADIWTHLPPLISTIKEYIEAQSQYLTVMLKITSEDHLIVRGHLGEIVEVTYTSGPIMVGPGELVTPLAFFEDGNVAALATTFGMGRVVLCSVHPEAPWIGGVGEPSLPWLYPAMARWVAELELAPDYTPLQPWAKPSPIPSAIPVFAGALVLGTGMILGSRIRRGK